MPLLLTVLLQVLASGPPDVKWIDDEATAVIDLWKNEAATDADWQRVTATEGYRRLKAREIGMGRLFEDLAFRKFLDEPSLRAKADEYRAALDRLKSMDMDALGKRALDYLPAGAKLRASVYPLIKPLPNSFVWDVEKDPAIMIALDPARSVANIEVTIAHELHHIGYAGTCPSPEFVAWKSKRSETLQTAWTWVGAFGEGFAVLAAAGGPDTDPVASFGPEAESFRKGLRDQAADMRRLEDFFTDVADGSVTGDAVTNRARGFYGEMGPWYSVGYVQAVTIERAYGRARLIACYEDPRKLFATYNAAVTQLKSDLPKWTTSFVRKMQPD